MVEGQGVLLGSEDMERIEEPIAELLLVIPDLQTACGISGDGSVRFKFDAPSSELAEAMKLIAFGRDRVIRAVFYEADVQPSREGRGSGRVRKVGTVPGE